MDHELLIKENEKSKIISENKWIFSKNLHLEEEINMLKKKFSFSCHNGNFENDFEMVLFILIQILISK